MQNKIIQTIADKQVKTDIPNFRVGDTVVVDVKIVEGKKERIQKFEGVVISRRAKEAINATFTVRKISNGVGVERIFPLHSPNVANVEVIKAGKVRRAKLYYLRGRSGKAARIKERIINKSK